MFTRTGKHKQGSNNRNCPKRATPYRPDLNGDDAPQLAARFLEWYILQGHEGYQVGESLLWGQSHAAVASSTPAWQAAGEKKHRQAMQLTCRHVHAAITFDNCHTLCLQGQEGVVYKCNSTLKKVHAALQKVCKCTAFACYMCVKLLTAGVCMQQFICYAAEL